MGIFDKKQSLSKEELKSAFRKDKGVIPKTGGRKYHNQERAKMTKEIFGTKYGSQISKNEYKHALRGLESTRNQAKSRPEKEKIERKINYLRNIGGKKI